MTKIGTFYSKRDARALYYADVGGKMWRVERMGEDDNHIYLMNPTPALVGGEPCPTCGKKVGRRTAAKSGKVAESES